MILTCPACGTRYTVKDGAIPPGGRQVRCANCKHSWHQDPDANAAPPAGEAPAPAQPVDSPSPVPISTAYPAAEDAGAPGQAAWSEHAHPDVVDDDRRADDADASPLPEERAAAVDSGWRNEPDRVEPQPAEPQAITGGSEPQPALERQPDYAGAPIGISDGSEPDSPALTTGESGQWVAPLADNPADSDFAAYDGGTDDAGGGRGKALLGLLAALLLIVVAVLAFWFLAPASLKQRLGLAQASDTQLKVQVEQQSRRTLASGQQVLEVSGRVINPTDQTQAVPQLHAFLRSLDQQVVYRWTIPPPAPSLQPGTSASFNSAELNIPASAACLDVYLDKPLDKPCRAGGTSEPG